MPNVAVIGAQWGDEGKGKVVDWLASRADIVVRFQGGHNAGHTLVVGNQTYKLSLLPSGLVRGKLGIIGNGVVVDPDAVLRAAPPRAARRRAYLPVGLDGSGLRAQGFATVAGLDPVADPAAEALRLACTHVLTPDGLVALEEEAGWRTSP